MRLLAVAALFVCASSCQTRSAPPTPAIKMHAAEFTNTLTPSDRAEIFDLVWRTVNEDYYDPSFHGVNWVEVRERYHPRMEAAENDQEFYAQFEVMLAELRDAHTSFSPPPPQGTPPEGQPASGTRVITIWSAESDHGRESPPADITPAHACSHAPLRDATP